MAGFQSCYRKLLIVGTPRVISKNGILHQPSRGRHNLIFGLCIQKNNLFYSKSRLNFDGQYIYRLASTNVTEQKVLPTKSEVPSPANTSSSETAPVESPSSNFVIDEASLPPVPSVESDIPVLEFVTTGLGEPSIKSLGLGSWYPTGLLQQFMEFFHVSFDLPWWAAIAGVTFILRLVTFPITLSCRRDTTNMLNNMPVISQYQMKINEAKRDGDYYLAATHMQELQQFIIEKKINLFSFIKPMLFQTPFFISMFWGLKGMADAPVETFKTQGLLWFSDLTASDPYYALPVVLGASIYAVIKVGADGVSMQSVNNHVMQLVLKGLPILVFAVSTQFSTCIVWYWTISNSIVLAQTALLKMPPVAKFFNIPKAIRHDPSVLRSNQKGFIEGFREGEYLVRVFAMRNPLLTQLNSVSGLSNAKITKEMEERERLNTLRFEKAGSAPAPRTFKHNPKLVNAPKAVPNKI